LRQLLADVTGTSVWPEVSASYCVDKLVASLRRCRWVVVLDGLEVVQHESGPWFGRLVHPELGRLLEELASAPSPSVLIVTTRFPLPDLAKRRHARLLSLSSLDPASACGLLRSLGVRGEDEELQAAADSCGRHAKAVELLGTYLAHYHEGAAAEFCTLPELDSSNTADEERHVARGIAPHQSSLSGEASDIVPLATALREPPTRERLLEYLRSEPVCVLLHQTWGRSYPTFAERPFDWLESIVSHLIELRLLEEVDAGGRGSVLDA